MAVDSVLAKEFMTAFLYETVVGWPLRRNKPRERFDDSIDSCEGVLPSPKARGFADTAAL